MKYFLFILVLFTSIVTISQEGFSKKITLITENDLYVSTYKDEYYTSGVFFAYRYLSEKRKESLEKRILEWQLVHKIYTPYRSIVYFISNHDRPFAGYLYGSFGINSIYKTKQILNTTLQVGVIGSNSFAKELQGFVHNIYGFREPSGWEYQIENALVLNFKAEYLKTILKTKEHYFDITWANKLHIGTVHTNISTGFYTRIGFNLLQNITNSIGFNTGLNNEQTNYFREIESFLYLKPMLRYALYDATLQGSFLNTSSLVTKELIPLVFDIELGIKFTSNRFNFGYVFIYNTDKSKGLKHPNGHKYGRIVVSYVLH